MINAFLSDAAGFLKSHFKGPKCTIKKVVLPVRVKYGSTEEEIVVAHGCWKGKKLICGSEEEIVVAHGRQPSPARKGRSLENLFTIQKFILDYTGNLVSVVENWFIGLFTFNLIRLT